MAFPTYTAALLLAPSTSGLFTLGHATDGRLGTGALAGEWPDAGWTAVQSRLRAFSCRRGRADASSAFSPGTMDVTLDDDDGVLDPDNTGSGAPWAGNVRINKRARVQATWSSVTYTLSSVFADAYAPSPQGFRGAVVTITGTDLFKRLDRTPAGVGFPAQLTGARLHALLDLIDWPTEKRVIDAGYLRLPPDTRPGEKALAHADRVVRAERGAFFMRGDGSVVFHDRYHRQTVTSRGTFGAGSSLPLRVIEGDYSEQGLANQILAPLASAGGATVSVAGDAASQKEHGLLQASIPQETASLLGSDEAIISYAQGLLGELKQPISRVRAVELDAQASDSVLWPHILGAEVGDRITLTHSLAGFTGLTAIDFFIESVTHEVSFSETGIAHRCAWGLSRAPATTYLQLGHATFGRLGTGALGF